MQIGWFFNNNNDDDRSSEYVQVEINIKKLIGINFISPVKTDWENANLNGAIVLQIDVIE